MRIGYDSLGLGLELVLCLGLLRVRFMGKVRAFGLELRLGFHGIIIRVKFRFRVIVKVMVRFRVSKC